MNHSDQSLAYWLSKLNEAIIDGADEIKDCPHTLLTASGKLAIMALNVACFQVASGQSPQQLIDNVIRNALIHTQIPKAALIAYAKFYRANFEIGNIQISQAYGVKLNENN